MQVALDGSVRAANKIVSLKSVFDFGKDAENDLERRLKSIAENVSKSPQQLAEKSGGHTVRSNDKDRPLFPCSDNWKSKAIFAAFRHSGVL